VNQMLDEYYDLRGWDRNGIPTEDKLKEMGLLSAAEELKRMGKIQ
jgi:aldehyde:ferredoxin oxidoreductase